MDIKIIILLYDDSIYLKETINRLFSCIIFRMLVILKQYIIKKLFFFLMDKNNM